MRFWIPLAVSVSVLVTPAAAQTATGEWRVEDGYADIRIVDCGGALWGVVAWEKSPGGQDIRNPDLAKRSRPTLGMPVLLNMQLSRTGWWEGEIYNSENGRTYQSRIALLDADTLRVEGCVLGFLCGGQKWTRVPPPQPPASVSRQAPPSRQRNTQQGTVGQSANPNAAPDPASASDADLCSTIVGTAGRPH